MGTAGWPRGSEIDGGLANHRQAKKGPERREEKAEWF